MLSALNGHKVKLFLVQQQIKPNKMNNYAYKRTEKAATNNNLFYFSIPLHQI